MKVTILMSMRQCARYIGIPYQTLNNYRLRMPVDIPYTEVGSAKLVDPELVREMLLKEGYRFRHAGIANVSGAVQKGAVYKDPQQMSVQESAVYKDPQQMLADIENGKLEEE